MKKIIIILSFLSVMFFANAYEGLYFDTYVGIDAHLVLDNISFVTANPYSAKALTETNVAADFNFDIGYTFYKVPISIAIGMELSNWVDPNIRLILKYNFMAEKLLSPYVYLEGHASLLDLLGFGVHLGGGLDIQFTEWFFLGIDVRAGYEAESKIQTKQTTNITANDLENEIEASLSIGIGFKIPTRKLYLEHKQKNQPENNSKN